MLVTAKSSEWPITSARRVRFDMTQSLTAERINVENRVHGAVARVNGLLPAASADFDDRLVCLGDDVDRKAGAHGSVHPFGRLRQHSCESRRARSNSPSRNRGD